MNRSEGERRILQRGWLAEQDEEIRSAVLQRARLAKHSESDFVFHAGDEAGGICGVVSGGIGVYFPTTNGEFNLVHIGRCGMWFGYGPLVRGRRRSLSFSPTEPTWLLHVPLPALQEVARMSPLHQRALLSVSEYGMDAAAHTIETLIIRNPTCRIAATLLRVAPLPEEHAGVETDIVLTQSQLAELACIGRHTVNRALQEMEEKGWLRSTYGKIRILDRYALAAFATNG
jgi:CRP/FNR family transcriptional regulator, cyclic AMP receptor protein